MSGAGRVPGAARRVVRGAGTGAASDPGVADAHADVEERPEDDDLGWGLAAPGPDDDRFLRERPPHWG